VVDNKRLVLFSGLIQPIPLKKKYLTEATTNQLHKKKKEVTSIFDVFVFDFVIDVVQFFDTVINIRIGSVRVFVLQHTQLIKIGTVRP